MHKLNFTSLQVLDKEGKITELKKIFITNEIGLDFAQSDKLIVGFMLPNFGFVNVLFRSKIEANQFLQPITQKNENI